MVIAGHDGRRSHGLGTLTQSWATPGPLVARQDPNSKSHVAVNFQLHLVVVNLPG